MAKIIGLVEMASHNEVLWAYIQVFLKVPAKVAVYCSDKVKSHLYDLHGHSEIQWVTGPEQTIPDLLIQNQEKLQSYELLIFTTILPYQFKPVMKLMLPCPTGLVIHDVHFMFQPEAHFGLNQIPGPGILDFMKICRFLLLNEKYRNTRLLHSFNFWIFPSVTVFEYYQKLAHNQPPKPGFVFEFAVTKNNFQRETKISSRTIVIPGSISTKSRNYEPVIKAFTFFSGKQKQPTELILLGKPIDVSGRRIVRQFRDLENEDLRIHTYKDFVPQQEFDRVMESAKFLILPISQAMNTFPFIEKSGFSCVSGNINDLVKYRKNAIIPSFYPLREELGPVTLRYTDPTGLKACIDQYLLEQFDPSGTQLAFQNFEATNQARKLQDNISKLRRFIKN